MVARKWCIKGARHQWDGAQIRFAGARTCHPKQDYGAALIRCAQQTMYKTKIPASGLFGGTKRDWANSRPFVYLTGPEVHSLICSIFVYEKNRRNLSGINFLSHWLTRHRHAVVPKEITITYDAQEKGCLFWKCLRSLSSFLIEGCFP